MIANFVVIPRIAKMYAHIRSYFSTESIMTLVIDESYDKLFSSAEAYIGANSTPSILGINQDIVNDTFDNIQVKWRSNFKDKTLVLGLLKSYEISFEKKHKDKVMNSYLPHVLLQGKAIQEQTKKRRINFLQNMTWISSSELDKSITFSTVSISSELKQQVIQNLNKFMNSEEYYRRIGKARKRTYLISGTVDRDKSRLISAMANHLNYSIYEVDLSEYVEGDDIRELLLHHITRSILVVKDIESPIEVEPAYKKRKGEASARINEVRKQNLLLKLLRSINGLWLPRGNDVIIVFTTNNREKIQPNLFEPGWIDMQIDFSCSTDTIEN